MRKQIKNYRIGVGVKNIEWRAVAEGVESSDSDDGGDSREHGRRQ